MVTEGREEVSSSSSAASSHTPVGRSPVPGVHQFVPRVGDPLTVNAGVPVGERADVLRGLVVGARVVDAAGFGGEYGGLTERTSHAVIRFGVALGERQGRSTCSPAGDEPPHASRPVPPRRLPYPVPRPAIADLLGSEAFRRPSRGIPAPRVPQIDDLARLRSMTDEMDARLMYSRDAISGRRRGRPEATAEMVSGPTCLVCGTDWRQTRSAHAGTSSALHAPVTTEVK